MSTFPFTHVDEVSAQFNVYPREVMDVLDGFVQEMTNVIEIEYQNESYDLDSLEDVVGYDAINEIGDKIAAQLFDDYTTSKFVALTLHYIPEGEIFYSSYVVSAMCDAVADSLEDVNNFEKAAKKAFEESNWSSIASVDGEFNVQVNAGN